MAETNFEQEMNKEIERRVAYYENNTVIEQPFSKVNYLGAFAFALLGIVFTIIAAF